MLECEVKFGFGGPGEAEELLESKKVRLSAPAREENAILDNRDRSLALGRILFRIRSTAGKTIMTVKTPVESGRMKIRREIETVVACSPGDLERMFEPLGFRVVRRYSKMRRTGKLGDATLCLDVLHFGTFLEIEAPSPGSLDKATKALGLDPADGLKETYIELEDRAALHG